MVGLLFALVTLLQTQTTCHLPQQALKAERLVVGLPAADPTRKEVFFPVDQRMRVDVDMDVQVCCAMLCRVALCHAVPCCAVLRCVVACCAVLCCGMLCCAAGRPSGCLPLHWCTGGLLLAHDVLAFASVHLPSTHQGPRACAPVHPMPLQPLACAPLDFHPALPAWLQSLYPSCGPCIPPVQELWLSVGEQLPEEDEEMAAELRKIGGLFLVVWSLALPGSDECF